MYVYGLSSLNVTLDQQFPCSLNALLPKMTKYLTQLCENHPPTIPSLIIQYRTRKRSKKGHFIPIQRRSYTSISRSFNFEAKHVVRHMIQSTHHQHTPSKSTTQSPPHPPQPAPN